MNTLSGDVIDIIKFATIMEINGRSFYEHAAEITQNEHGKNVFTKLAQDEIGHIQTFGDIFTTSLGSDEWKMYIDHEEKNKNSVLDKLKDRVVKQAHQDRAGDLEALRIGMELERDSIAKYEQWSQKAQDEKIKDIFNKIIAEEKFHYDLLQAEYDNLTGSGFWFDMAEFRMDGKY